MKSVFTSLFAILLLVTGGSFEKCDDADPGACAILYQQNHALCDDSVFSSSTCPRTCKRCRLTCYHCDNAVQSLHQCNSTRTCEIGEQCMWLETTSTDDGHHGYRMNCATTTFCDGNAILAVGKRSLNARDVTIRCCTSDKCNNPALLKTTMTTTTTPPPPPTTPPPPPTTTITTTKPTEKSTIVTRKIEQSTQPPVNCQSEWSNWTNTDTPNTGDGDREIWTKDQLNAFCPLGNITGIECQTTDGVASFATGEIMSCTTANGAVCLNNDNFPIPCSDFRIRYFCDCTAHA